MFRLLARWVLIGMSILAIAFLVRTILLRDFSLFGTAEIIRLGMIYVAPLGSFAVLGFYLALSRRNVQVLGLILVLSAVAPLYIMELYLQYIYLDQTRNVRRAAEQANRQYDPRGTMAVVADLRETGVDARPFFRLLRLSGELMPLGNWPNKTIVYCNEIGDYFVFRADRHGFNNPDSVWDNSPTDVVLLGDSFTHGACSPENNGFAEMIRRRLPRTVNLAVGGNNPQLNLASIIEYGPHLRPGNILWIHYAGNDLAGMMKDKTHPILRQYVYNNFSQGLIGRSSEVEQLMEKFFAINFGKLQKKTEKLSFLNEILLKREGLFRLSKLYFLRNRLGLVQDSGADIDFPLFTDIVKRMAAQARAMGSRLHFVSVPAVGQVGLPSDPKGKRVRAIVEALDIAYYDLAPVFLATDDVQSIYAFGLNGGHLSHRGNELVADFVLKTVLPANKY